MEDGRQSTAPASKPGLLDNAFNFPQCILQYTLRSSFFNLFLDTLASNTVMASGWRFCRLGWWREFDGGSDHLMATNFDAMLLD